jgi:hypothetical protein
VYPEVKEGGGKRERRESSRELRLTTLEVAGRSLLVVLPLAGRRVDHSACGSR